MDELSETGKQLLEMAGWIVAGLFVVFSTVVGVLLKMILSKANETNKMIEPVSNGFADETAEKLETLVNGYEGLSDDNAQIKVSVNDVKLEQHRMSTEQQRLANEVCSMKETDEALFELLSRKDES